VTGFYSGGGFSVRYELRPKELAI